jgi:hypothetical protein
MSENLFNSKYQPKKRSPLKPFYPVIGLFILIVFGAISYFLSRPVTELVDARTTIALEFAQLQLVIAIGIFIVLILALAAVYSVFQPKTPKGVSERDLDREKQEKMREAAAANRRKKEMQAKMRARNKQNNR